jgi:cobaltochelatase CobN
VTTADTEILATLAAVERLPGGFPEVRCANPRRRRCSDDFLDGARVVLCRILGGRRGWSDGFDALRARCRARGSRCSPSAARRSPTPR